MGDPRCEACGAERGVDGPCPGCGELPAVPIVGVGVAGEATSEARSVATAELPRRRATLGVVIVLAALVAASIAWDALRRDEDGGSEQAAERDPEPGTTSTTRPASSPSTRPSGSVPEADQDSIPSFAAVAGFEDRWLVVVDSPRALVWQVPLGGGSPSTIGGADADTGGGYGDLRDGRLAGGGFVVDGYLVLHGGGIALDDGTRWDGEAAGSVGHIIGITTDDTVVYRGHEQVIEVHADGRQVGSVDLVHPAMGGRSWPAGVAGRTVLVQGSHGVIGLDLDTGAMTRVAVGEVLAVGSELAVVDSCDDLSECRVQVIEAATGAVRQVLDVGDRPDAEPSETGYSMRTVLSPDGAYVAVLADDRLVVIDITTGARPIEVEVPAGPDWRPHELTVQWSPTASTALVLVTAIDGPTDHRGTVEVLHLDLDTGEAQALDDLRDSLQAITATSGGRVDIFLSDRGYPSVGD